MAKMLGIINDNGYEKVNRVYDISEESPTITARDYKDPIKILDIKRSKNMMLTDRQTDRQTDRVNRCIIIGQMDNIRDHTYESANRVYSPRGICPTIPICASDKTPKVLVKELTVCKVQI